MDDWYTVEQVESDIAYLATHYPKWATLIPLPAPTAEWRSCSAIRIGSGQKGSKDVLMLVAGMHGCEMGGCAVALNFVADLLEAVDRHVNLVYGHLQFTPQQVQQLLQRLHIVVFPLVNPDGYNYSKTIEPTWRKNRNTAYAANRPEAIGVDINRNFDFLFDFGRAFAPGSAVSASNDPIDGVYQGPRPFSEPETQNVKWLLDDNPRTRWFVDLHSRTSDVLYAWGDDEVQTGDPTMRFDNSAFDGRRGLDGDAYQEYMLPHDVTIHAQLAQALADNMLAVRGTVCQPGLAFEYYPTSGASHDYVYSRHLADDNLGKVFGFVVEWGGEIQPPLPTMDDHIKDVTAGLIGFCLAAAALP